LKAPVGYALRGKHGFDVARNRNHRSALFARIHQSVEKVDNARSRCSANRDGYTGEVSVCDSGEYAVFFISHMHKFHISISAQRIDHRIKGGTDNSITAFYAGTDKHFPQQISHLSGHSDLYLLSRKNECKAISPIRVERFVLLQNAQYLRLQLQEHIADLIQEQGATMGRCDSAGSQRDLRSLLIADMWIQSGHQHQTITEMLSDALLIGLDPNGAAITKRTRGVRHELEATAIPRTSSPESKGIKTESWRGRS